jgi:acetyltransferase-like isoleucine patch superfamily enzyme
VNQDRTLPWDWYPGRIPENVVVDETAYLQTTYSFHLFRSKRPNAIEIGRGASVYLGTMFDLGPEARAQVGQFALINGARIIGDTEIVIGDFALISWNVVLMDTYRLPLDPLQRRKELERLLVQRPPGAAAHAPARPIYIERNVWIGFDVCVLPGVIVGEGSVVGARSVVSENVPPFTVVVGNPARVIRRLEPGERALPPASTMQPSDDATV